MAKRFPTPRKWSPSYPEKYVGDANAIVSRSSWETKFLNWADTNPQVLKYSSEEVVIPYFSPVDKKMHRYFVDFALMVKTNQGTVEKYLVEIKPDAQTRPPTGKKKTKALLEATKTYVVNSAKWEAADAWCKKNGFKFIVLTEHHLNV